MGWREGWEAKKSRLGRMDNERLRPEEKGYGLRKDGKDAVTGLNERWEG